jgi:hypothetical protein
MANTVKDKTWSDLTPNQVEHFHELLSGRARMYGDWARATWLEFAKFLFAANTGAAAGLFLLAKADAHLLPVAFSCFCGGAFSVGIGFFALSSYAHEIGVGWSADAQAVSEDRMTFGELDARHSERCYSSKMTIARLSLGLSFILLIGGGVMAAKALWLPDGKFVPKAAQVVPAKP